MSSSIISLVGAYWPAMVILVIILYVLRNRFSYNLHSTPGPFLNSISAAPRMISVWNGKSHLDDHALHLKYGPIVRVAPHIISISDLSAVDQIYGISSNFFKSDFWEPVRFYDEEGIVPDPLVLKDKTLHSRMKRNANNAYATTSLIQLEPLLDDIIERLLRVLDEAYVNKPKVCDIGEYLHFFSMDAIFALTFGNDLNFIEKGDKDGNIQMLQDSMRYLSVVGQSPWMHRYLKGNPYIDFLIGLFSKSSNGTILEQIMNIAISQRTKTLEDMSDDPDAPCTFLKRLLLNQQRNPKSITDRELNTHSFGNIIAGGDTTSTAMRAVFANVTQYPEKADRLVAELLEAGCDKDSIVRYTVSSNLPYLNAFIKESMRLHPSVGMMLSREVPQGGAMIGPYKVAAGTEVGVNAWIIHRDPDIFPNPDEFNPDRWITADASDLSRMKRAFFAFGGGRHTCSGQHISMFEISKLLPTLLLRYRTSWVHPNDYQNIDVSNYFFTVQKGVKVNLTSRD
ncbi:unnamed protein product [Clonostachys rosea]|uniref:Cytochrome P450 n=1 Tax=Bionectria ochroleuca TaxID=29856 RepID=A0ABY6U272_BIOOC|nr:unnamed protein product [Clonostachys rosea]